MTNASYDRSKLAKNGQEYVNLLGSDADWIVRGPDDLSRLRATNDGPLAKLPEDDFRAFVEGLEFRGGGVGGGSYRMLMSSLTISEIFEVFERFGMSPEYARSALEEKCTGSGCKYSFWDFCSSSCEQVALPTK